MSSGIISDRQAAPWCAFPSWAVRQDGHMVDLTGDDVRATSGAVCRNECDARRILVALGFDDSFIDALIAAWTGAQ